MMEVLPDTIHSLQPKKDVFMQILQMDHSGFIRCYLIHQFLFVLIRDLLRKDSKSYLLPKLVLYPEGLLCCLNNSSHDCCILKSNSVSYLTNFQYVDWSKRQLLELIFCAHLEANLCCFLDKPAIFLKFGLILLSSTKFEVVRSKPLFIDLEQTKG